MLSTTYNEIAQISSINDIKDIPPISNEDFKDKYIESLALYQNGEWEKSLEGFKYLLTIGTNSDLLDNCQYWLGEIYYFNKEDSKEILEIIDKKKIKVLSNEILIRFKKANRRNFINKNLVQSMNSSKKFVYFPLSVDMERNLLIGSPYFTNQIELIKNIAQSLPVEYSLFVKENPSQESREWRST